MPSHRLRKGLKLTEPLYCLTVPGRAGDEIIPSLPCCGSLFSGKVLSEGDYQGDRQSQ